MNCKSLIFDSISFIEDRLSDEISIDYLADRAVFSKSHYQRLFHAAIGEPVMEYIKKRRLRRAGIALCETDATVLEIALKSGYTSHEGFSRAFKEYFGMPPLQYRKRYAETALYHKEVKDMITGEARKNIVQYANDIVRDWEIITAELEKWVTKAEYEIEKSEQTARGMKVAFSEWASLTSRISEAKNETIHFFTEKTDVYELYDKAGKIMKVIDDITFQINLLRFLTGVEWARMGRHRIPFTPILEGLTMLCETENKRKESAVKLVSEINGLIQDEIHRETISCIKQSAETLREVAKEGDFLTERLNRLVIELGMYGRGFALIAKETEKSASFIRNAEYAMQKLSAEFPVGGKMFKNGLERQAADDFYDSSVHLTYVENNVYNILRQLGDSAFKMNLNAFNAAVESARSGEQTECVECADNIRKYAGKIQQAYNTCILLDKDFIKLTTLIKSENENTEDRRFQKHFDDIIFQAEFLNTQLNMEAERSQRGDFRSLAQEFQKASDMLRYENQREEQMNKTDKLKACIELLTELIEQGNAVAEAAEDHGTGIAYILNEFNLFTERARGSFLYIG